MRTTLTLDPDVASEVERLRREKNLHLKDLVNEALRLGLRELTAPAKTPRFHIKPIAGVTPRLASFDNIAEVLAVAEGDAFT